MIERQDIETRLQNWGQHYRPRAALDAYRSTTAVVCDQMAAAAMGNIYDRDNGIEPQETSDERDATLIQRNMAKVTIPQRLLLSYCYIHAERPKLICHLLKIKKDDFDQVLTEAKEAIEDAVNGGNK